MFCSFRVKNVFNKIIMWRIQSTFISFNNSMHIIKKCTAYDELYQHDYDFSQNNSKYVLVSFPYHTIVVNFGIRKNFWWFCTFWGIRNQQNAKSKWCLSVHKAVIRRSNVRVEKSDTNYWNRFSWGKETLFQRAYSLFRVFPLLQAANSARMSFRLMAALGC